MHTPFLFETLFHIFPLFPILLSPQNMLAGNPGLLRVVYFFHFNMELLLDLDLDFFSAFRLGDLDLDLDLDLDFPPRKEPTKAPAIAPEPFEPFGAKRPPMAAPVRAFVNRLPPSICVSVKVSDSILFFFFGCENIINFFFFGCMKLDN